MNGKKIAIIGGGLSGLYAAYLLEKKGITDYVLLEARDALGGRIMDFTAQSEQQLQHFDLGPTWFWPEFQPQLESLIAHLGLQTFAQYEDGNMVVERTPNEAPILIKGFTSAPASMRIKGGMGQLIRTLSAHLKNQHIHLNAEVQSIHIENNEIAIAYQDNQQRALQTVIVEHIFLAMPPRLAVNNLQFAPALPKQVLEQWQNTATWMAAHAKYVAVYDAPFWREQGLSGDARSALGPMVEIHDASTEQGGGALFGFLGVPAANRKTISTEEMKMYCRAQMGRLFGPKAATPVTDTIKDWVQDPLTATKRDLEMVSEHGHTPQRTIKTGPWQEVLVGIGSEWSTSFPGYVAGAVESATDGVNAYLSLLTK